MAPKFDAQILLSNPIVLIWRTRRCVLRLRISELRRAPGVSLVDRPGVALRRRLAGARTAGRPTVNAVFSALALVAPMAILCLAYAAHRAWSWRASQRPVSGPVTAQLEEPDE